MRLLWVLFALGCLFLCFKAWGEEYWQGVVTSPDGGSFNNTTTSQTFTLQRQAKLAVQCDNAACVRASPDAGMVASCTSSTSKGPAIQAQQLFDLPLDAVSNVVAIIPVTPAATNCDVYLVVP